MFILNATSFLLLAAVLPFLFHAEAIEQVDDKMLISLLTSNDYLLVLFTKRNCHVCNELENVLVKMEDSIKEDLGAALVKSHESHLLRMYNPKEDPSIIFFRKGSPLLYHGERNPDDILDFFVNNKEPVVKELSDDTFEHLTQASSGSTTGDWLVFFYSPECNICQRLHAIWEGVGAKYKRTLNVAKVNQRGAGIETAKRFNVSETPYFILIQQGFFYRYKSAEFDIESFVEFISSKNKISEGSREPVPPVKNKFNEMIEELSSYIKIILLLTVFFIFIVFVSRKYSRGKDLNKKI